MHIKTISISNFRAIEHIDVEFADGINVIAGPNAIGKTTIMEAIRISKALLAPRTGQEQTQVLLSLGASSPHMPQRVFLDALARDPNQPISIVSSYSIHSDEIEYLKAQQKQISTALVQNQLGQVFGSPAAIIHHLSTEAGQKQIAQAEDAIGDQISVLDERRRCDLALTIDPQTQRLSGNNGLTQLLVGALDQRLPPHQSLFSYFPADRAFPSGEQPIQIGSQDTPAQIESHNSQPQLKFARLKHTIITSLLQGEHGSADLHADFNRIFDRLLTGRTVDSIGIRPDLGLVSIKIRDEATGAVFDIDGMSSGEKAVIMTFLLIGRSVARHGLVLFDEPELHLNPAVCRAVLRFMVDTYVIPSDIQAILCTHSPEILSSAMDTPNCSLLHLRSPSIINPMRPKDTDELGSALHLLGASELDNLLYRGLLFVEGDDDAEILQAAFPDLLARLKVQQLGGRGEIERYIAQLESEQSPGSELARTAIIFDHDGRPTSLTSTAQTRIAQWDRYCIENYLLDADILTDVLKSADRVGQPIGSIGDMQRHLKRLALQQVNAMAARATYGGYNYPGTGARTTDLNAVTIDAMADRLLTRLQEAQLVYGRIDVSTWKRTFVDETEAAAAEIRENWATRWRELCNGKQLFADLQRELRIGMSSRRFKKLVVQEMRVRSTDDFNAMRKILASALKQD